MKGRWRWLFASCSAWFVVWIVTGGVWTRMRRLWRFTLLALLVTTPAWAQPVMHEGTVIAEVEDHPDTSSGLAAKENPWPS